MTSALAAGLVVHTWDRWRAQSGVVQRPSQPVAVRFPHGVQTGALDPPDAGRAAAELSVVVSNDGTTPITIRGIEVAGPGAGFVADPPGGPPTGLPRTVAAGQSTKIRFGMSSGCSVPVLARIPDLDSIWGLTLPAPACGAR